MFNVKVSENVEFGIPQEFGASYQSTMVNVVNTIIGAGILSIPSTIHSTGIIGSFLFLCASLLISLLGGYYLIVAAAYTKRDSFGEIAYVLYGPTMKMLANLTVIIYEMGVSTAYFVILFDQVGDLLQAWNIADSTFVYNNKWVSERSIRLYLVDHVSSYPVFIGSPSFHTISGQSQIHILRSGHLHSTICIHIYILGYCATC